MQSATNTFLATQKNKINTKKKKKSKKARERDELKEKRNADNERGHYLQRQQVLLIIFIFFRYDFCF